MFCFRYSEQRESRSDKDSLNILPLELDVYHTPQGFKVYS